MHDRMYNLMIFEMQRHQRSGGLKKNVSFAICERKGKMVDWYNFWRSYCRKVFGCKLSSFHGYINARSKSFNRALCQKVLMITHLKFKLNMLKTRWHRFQSAFVSKFTKLQKVSVLKVWNFNWTRISQRITCPNLNIVELLSSCIYDGKNFNMIKLDEISIFAILNVSLVDFENIVLSDDQTIHMLVLLITIVVNSGWDNYV